MESLGKFKAVNRLAYDLIKSEANHFYVTVSPAFYKKIDADINRYVSLNSTSYLVDLQEAAYMKAALYYMSGNKIFLQIVDHDKDYIIVELKERK